jgi:hypothetical protein
VKARGHLEDLGIDGDNIKINIIEVLWEVVDWINLAHKRQVEVSCENVSVLWVFIK